MTHKDKFTKAGFSLIESDNHITQNKLINFLKENYPQVIRDGEINLSELKTAAGMPVDEKVNGYGLNFIGRNVARAKYDQKTTKELKINETFSRDFDTTQNMVLKGDNLDCLKILKSHYGDQIKCIYIDPPYNTDNDNFVYPDKFDKEEQEVLGLSNLSQTDIDRLEFSFKNKKSHNGWLSFMYPRLMLARDLLSDDGVIFVSIDDNEQANLKLLMDDVFGEENFVECLKWKRKKQPSFLAKHTAKMMEYILVYSKNFNTLEKLSIDNISDATKKVINLTNPYSERILKKGTRVKLGTDGRLQKGKYTVKTMDVEYLDDVVYSNGRTNAAIKVKARFSVSQEKIEEFTSKDLLFITANKGLRRDVSKEEKEKRKSITDLLLDWGDNQDSENEMKSLFDSNIFEYSKPIKLIQNLIKSNYSENSIILDFFAGSGTTAHAVMQLNAEDGGNRKFILCQIDEPIKEDKPAYKFCIENNLPLFISSITCERIKRAGDKIQKEIEEENTKSGKLKENKKEILDIGFKVFDLTDAPKLELNDGDIVFENTDNDPFSRIYNMIFQVGIDNPMEKIDCVIENCMYKIGNHYYITNADKLDKEENKPFLSDAIKNSKIFIDGWTASINTTLQNYRKDVKIVF